MPSKYTDYELAVDHHKYVVEPGGKPQPGVTSLINLLNEDDKAGRMAASAAFITASAAYDQPHMPFQRLKRYYMEQWNAKSDIGSVVHTCISGEPRSWTPGAAAAGCLRAYDKWLYEHRPEIVAQEGILLNKEHGYGGRFDAIARINGQSGLIDYKTGRKHLYQVSLQLNAYARCGLGAYDLEGRLIDILDLGKIDFLAVLYLHEDGTYEYIDDLPYNVEMFADFVRLRELHRSLQNFKTFLKSHPDQQTKEAA